MTSLKNRIKQQALQVVKYQFIGIVFISLLTLIGFNSRTALSLFSGGMIYTLPNFIFVWRVFCYASVQQMHIFLAAFLFGEIIKLILCGILFLVIVKYLPVSLLSVLGGLALAILSFWIACVWQFSRHRML